MNHGWADASHCDSHACPASLARRASITSAAEGSVEGVVDAAESTARRASFFSSSSGWNRSTSTPATILAMARSGMLGKACLQKPKKSR